MTSHHRKKFSDEPFVGYIFDGPPPRQHRLWFIDRHVATLLRHGNVGILHRCQGVWKITDDPQTGTDLMALTGVCLHYEHTGSRWYDERMDTQRWTAVWKADRPHHPTRPDRRETWFRRPHLRPRRRRVAPGVMARLGCRNTEFKSVWYS